MKLSQEQLPELRGEADENIKNSQSSNNKGLKLLKGVKLLKTSRGTLYSRIYIFVFNTSFFLLGYIG